MTENLNKQPKEYKRNLNEKFYCNECGHDYFFLNQYLENALDCRRCKQTYYIIEPQTTNNK